MTKINNIRVFEGDCKYNVYELDIDLDKGSLDIYIECPDVSLKDIIEIYPDQVKIADEISNVLALNNILCLEVKFFMDSEIICLKLREPIATIAIADILNFPEEAIIPFWNGITVINTRLV